MGLTPPPLLPMPGNPIQPHRPAPKTNGMSRQLNYKSTLESELQILELLDWRLNRVFAFIRGELQQWEEINPLPSERGMVNDTVRDLQRQLFIMRQDERDEQRREARREVTKKGESEEKPYVITDWQRLKAAGWNVPEGGVLPPRPKPPPAPPRPNKEMP